MDVARRALSLVVGMLAVGGCANHYLVHPRQPDARIVTWSAEHTREPLLVRVEGARPPGPGPFPAVIVHPEGGGTARDMRGVVWDLAARGYLALAADYRRLIEGKYRWSLFAWRSPADVKAIVDIAREYALIDQNRIGLLGFSQGGVFSLLIAAHAPERVRAVVSYYPVTDFPGWLALERRSGLQRFAFRIVRWFFRRESGAESEAEFDRMLHEASAYYVAESIRAPVLLVHGERDTTAPVEESRRMTERLEVAGKTVNLLVVPDGKHIFNFRDRAQAAMAWGATLAWLDRYVGAQPDGAAH